MAKKDKVEYDKGYQAALEAIKKQIEQGNSNPADSADSSDQNSPNNGSNSSNNSNNQPGNGSNSGGSNGMSRTSKSDANQGVVRPEDCEGPGSLDDVPDTPGTMMDKAEGDKLAKQEGYEEEGGSSSQVEKDWKDRAMKCIGNMPGSFRSKIEGLYKPSKDWKKELKKVVGYSISPDEFRRAYTNKNVLITQDRIARTDKDKFDNLDYIIACVDSSGSMSDDQLKLCLSEVYQIALQKKPLSIYVIQCDTKIQSVQVFDNVQKLKKEISHATVKGRGGTELKPCWDLLKTDKRFKGRQAELVMLFTDGYCNQYKRDPRTMQNLCWVILDNTSFTPQFKEPSTKVVYLNTSDIK